MVDDEELEYIRTVTADSLLRMIDEDEFWIHYLTGKGKINGETNTAAIKVWSDRVVTYRNELKRRRDA